MLRGTVKWFDGEKGYGCIYPDDGGEDVFVHHTGIAGDGLRHSTKGRRLPTRWPRAGGDRRRRTSPGFLRAAARVLIEHFDPDELCEAMMRGRA